MQKTDYQVFVNKIRVPIGLVIIIWLIKIFETISGQNLFFLGVFPREWTGLLGVFTSPWVHGSWGHLASNTVPLLVLSTIIRVFYSKVFVQSLIMIMIGEGILVWLFGRASYHIGASGVVYGLISFVFWTGIFKKNSKSVVLSLIVLILYAGSVESIFPTIEENISWESHLFGAIVGLIVSFVLKNVVEEDEINHHISSWANESNSKDFFFPRDIFEKTKLDRYHENIYRDSNGNENSNLEKENNEN